MFKFFRLGAAMLASVLVLASCNKPGDDPQVDPTPKPTPEVKVVTVTVAPATLELTLGDAEKASGQLAATVENADDKTVTWSSEDDTKATVDATGKVTAVAAGSVKIIATSNADKKVTGFATVTIADPSLATFTSLTISKGTEAKEEITLNLSDADIVNPMIAETLTLSSDPAEGVIFKATVANAENKLTVSVTGKELNISTVANYDEEAEFTVTVTAEKEGYNPSTKTLTVKVVGKLPTAVEPETTTLSVQPETIDMKLDETKEFSITSNSVITLDNIDYDKTKLTLTDASYGPVKAYEITASEAGTFTITVTAGEGDNAVTKTVTVNVTANAPATPQDFGELKVNNGEPISLTVDEAKDFEITLTPAVAGVSYTARSNDFTFSKLSTELKDGNKLHLEGLGKGTVEVTVIAKAEGYNDKSIKVNVTITDAPEPPVTTVTGTDYSSTQWNAIKNQYTEITKESGFSCTASSSNPNRGPELFIDGSIADVNHMWHSENSKPLPHRLIVTCPEGTTIDALQVYNSVNTAHSGTEWLTIYYDGTSTATQERSADWKELGTIHFMNGHSEKNTLVLSGAITVKKLLFEITENYDSNTLCQLTELFLFKKNN